VQLSAIKRILEQTQPPGLGKSDELSLPHTLTSGPFVGLEIPFASAEANAAHVLRNLIDTYLITHPHLDHISGFVVNTAGLPGSRPKRLAGLPSTIAAFKTHIFNNIIWPNLSDENNGAGLVTYMRLVEGGSPALGDGDGKGYMEISDGLSVKVWGVSHGHCIEKHSHRGSGSSTRYGSMDASSMSMAMGMGAGGNMPLMSPRSVMQYNQMMNPALNAVLQQQQQHRDQMHLAGSTAGVLAGSSAPSGGQGAGSISAGGAPTETVCVYDSSAYFVRDVATGREILIFGDVEPDSISLSPRNQQIWHEAAPRIAVGNLVAIFIECSFDDSQSVDRLYGHLTPRYVVQEMTALADEVRAAKQRLVPGEETAPGTADPAASAARGMEMSLDKRKRKREGGGDSRILTRRMATRDARSASAASPSLLSNIDDPVSPRTVRPSRERSSLAQSMTLPDAMFSSTTTPHIATPTAGLSLEDVDGSAPATPPSVQGSVTSGPPMPSPLKGLKVVLIHLKEKLNDGPPIGEIVLGELEEYEKQTQLGCEYIISYAGQSLYF
jgi:3',5'-cyclic-nucleotide phosphodiesterase